MAELTQDQVFFNRVKEIFGVAQGRRKKVKEQQRFMDDLLAGLTDEKKDEIRKGMTFTLKAKRKLGKAGKSLDERGQLKELDPMEIRNKFQSISRDDKVKAHEAWGVVANEYLAKIKDAKDEKGEPLFGDPHAEPHAGGEAEGKGRDADSRATERGQGATGAGAETDLQGVVRAARARRRHPRVGRSQRFQQDAALPQRHVRALQGDT